MKMKRFEPKLPDDFYACQSCNIGRGFDDGECSKCGGQLDLCAHCGESIERFDLSVMY